MENNDIIEKLEFHEKDFELAIEMLGIDRDKFLDIDINAICYIYINRKRKSLIGIAPALDNKNDIVFYISRETIFTKVEVVKCLTTPDNSYRNIIVNKFISTDMGKK